MEKVEQLRGPLQPDRIVTNPSLLTIPHIPTYIERAATDEAMRQIAKKHFAELFANGMLDARPNRTQVSVSDAGSCRLSLWAKLHGETDIPILPRLQMTKLDPGTLLGAWYAALAAAALAQDGIAAELEPTVSFEERSGHIDLLIPGLHLVDFKGKFDDKVKAIEPPHTAAPWQLLQVGMYAEATSVPTFSIIPFNLSVQKKNRDGSVNPYMVQYDYTTESMRDLVYQEMARLKEAEADDLPPADPDNMRCWTCDYSQCTNNKRRMMIV